MELYCNPIADLAGPAIVGYNSLGQGRVQPYCTITGTGDRRKKATSVTGFQSFPGFVPCKVQSIEKVGDSACHQGGGCRRFTTSEPGLFVCIR